MIFNKFLDYFPFIDELCRCLLDFVLGSNNSEWSMNDLLKNNENSKTTLNTNNNNSNSNNNNINNNVSSNSNNDNVSSNNSNSTVISQAAGKTNKQIYNNHNNNNTSSNNHLKRPSNTSENSSKRAKSTNSQSDLNVSVVSSRVAKAQAPQLLQQLMAPSQQSQKSRMKDGQRWNGNNGTNSSTNKTIPLQQSSNSVLMNLLVSGCDVSAGYTCFPRPTKVAKA